MIRDERSELFNYFSTLQRCYPNLASTNSTLSHKLSRYRRDLTVITLSKLNVITVLLISSEPVNSLMAILVVHCAEIC